MRARHLAAALGAAILAGIAPGTALAGDPIMPLSQLRPGMQCTGYSVIRGTDISSFDVEIVDVLSGDASGNDGPRILIRVSGPAVDRTGVGPGFSGSPIYCDGKNAGAISEAIGEYGGKTVLATPIEEILSNPPDAPRGKPIARQSRGRARAAAGRAADGLRPERRDRRAAGARGRTARRARRQVLVAPTLPLSPFPPPRRGRARRWASATPRATSRSARSARSPTSTATACGASATRSRTRACARCCCRTPTSTR